MNEMKIQEQQMGLTAVKCGVVSKNMVYVIINSQRHKVSPVV